MNGLQEGAAVWPKSDSFFTIFLEVCIFRRTNSSDSHSELSVDPNGVETSSTPHSHCHIHTATFTLVHSTTWSNLQVCCDFSRSVAALRGSCPVGSLGSLLPVKVTSRLSVVSENGKSPPRFLQEADTSPWLFLSGPSHRIDALVLLSHPLSLWSHGHAFWSHLFAGLGQFRALNPHLANFHTQHQSRLKCSHHLLEQWPGHFVISTVVNKSSSRRGW